MKRILYSAVLASLSTLAMAQETYQNAELMRPELTGTARYVGMGGALEALGADISTISTNPAGIGLFRHSMASVSAGLVSQQDAKDFANANKTNMSFDQAGFVYSTRTSRTSFLNFAFNYSKSRNFDEILYAAGRANKASLSKVPYNKEVALYNENQGGNQENPRFTYIKNNEVLSEYRQYTQIDYLYFNTLTYDAKEKNFFCYDAEDYLMNRGQTGYIGRYDFNISGNIKDRVYLGLTFGLHDVHYKSYSQYSEKFVASTAANSGFAGTLLDDTREITGTGYDITLGAIFRPFADSPFRVGLSVATPTWYELTTRNYTVLAVYNNDAQNTTAKGLDIDNYYDFKLYTPWKFGVSLGHTVGNYLALGASYEYADYGSSDNRIINGHDVYGNSTSVSDRDMNANTKMSLKGVSTLKLGVEFKPDPAISARLGFNYVSPLYAKNGYKNSTVYSYGTSYQSMADFTNWESTYRFTAGVGYKIGKVNLDLAYQYNTTKGTFYPFYDTCDGYVGSNYNNERTGFVGVDSEANNMASPAKVSNKRHQLLLTIGYTL